MSERHKTRYDRRRAAGRCVRCPAKAQAGYALCAECSARQLACKRGKRAADARDDTPVEVVPWRELPRSTGGHKRTYPTMFYCAPAGSLALALLGKDREWNV